MLRYPAINDLTLVLSANQFLVPDICFFFNDTTTTEIYTLSLHDALPISGRNRRRKSRPRWSERWSATGPRRRSDRSEEHTSELQSQFHLVCRLLLEKKNKAPMRNSLTQIPDDEGLAIIGKTREVFARPKA